MPLNLYSDVSAIAQRVESDAIFVLRELAQMQGIVTVFTDASGLNPRRGYKYNAGTAVTVAEADDLTSKSFTPTAAQTLTPAEIGFQFFVSDSRAESDLPESILNDASTELGLAAADKVEADLVGDIASLTGGTIGTAGSVITWGYLSAAISVARFINKSNLKPLAVVVHEYQWSVLAKNATLAGATVAATAPGFQEEITRSGFVATFSGAPIYKTFQAADTSGDFTGGVFPREALAIDWRRQVRIRPERDESRRGLELNMSALYAHGVWQPDRGVKMIFDAAAPTS